MSGRPTLPGLALAALALLSPPAARAQATLDDFAWHLPITGAGAGPLYELRLPLAVYRGATDARLGDLRVFNAAGDVVPHGLLPSALDTPATPPRLVDLPLFPFAEAAAAAGDVDIEVRRDGDRTRVTVRGEDDARGGEAWVVDTERLQGKPRALLLRWPDAAAPLTRRVRLAGSNDLSHWQPLGGPVTVADVRWAGERLLADRIELRRGSAHRFYRIEAADGGPPLPLLAVQAEFPPGDAPAARREWLEVPVKPLDDPAGALAFETPPALPVERLRVTPAERNSFVRLRVEALGADGQWRGAGHGSAYRLDFDNGSIEGAPIAVQAPGATAWRLLPAEDSLPGAGFGRTPPVLEVGWTPRSLVFLARGDGPFVLAWGSRRVEPVHADGRRLLGDAVAIVDLPRAGTGEPTPGSRPQEALDPPLRVDWKHIVLWSVLVGGVALLGVLAVRLLRRQGEGSD